MKNILRTGLTIGLKSWTTLLCFEIIYKVLGYSLLWWLFDAMKTAILKSSGISYIGQQNAAELFKSPRTVALMLCAFILLAYFVYLEITALFIYCEAGWQGKRISLTALCRKAFTRSLRVFHYKNLPVFLALIPVITLSIFPLTNGFLNAVQIPEFILDYIQESSWLLPLFLAALLLLNVLLYYYLFSFPSVILSRGCFWGSLKENRELLRGRKLRTLMYLIFYGAIFLVVSLFIFILMILLVYLSTKIYASPDGGRSMFELYFQRWSAVCTVLLGILWSVSLTPVIITLYHNYRGDAPAAEGADDVRGKRIPVWRRILAAVLTFILLVLYSEMYDTQNMYIPADAGQTVIVAHRAGAAFAPENTVAALRESIAAGAGMAEIDVQQTSDGELIIMHDTSFRRTAGVKKKVWETDYATVRTFRTGGEPIPTLAEMLQEARDGNIMLMIELKSSGRDRGLVEETIRQIKAADMLEHCMIASMDPELLRQSKEAEPGLETVYISMLMLSDTYELDFVDSYSVETSFLTAGLVAQVHAINKKIFAWTANTDDTILKILRAGADGLITDNPALASYHLESLGDNMFLQFISDLLYGASG